MKSVEASSATTATPAENEDEALVWKASIYFKFSRNRTRNRTFPGSVNKRGRSLLQEWSRQFRIGHSSHQGSNLDTRCARSTAKRCKLAVITRKRAFEWFRMSQEKYALMYLKGDIGSGVGVTRHVDQISMYRVPPARVVQFEPCLFVRQGDNTAYVEITWDNQVQFPELPGVWGLNFGHTRVPVFPWRPPTR